MNKEIVEYNKSQPYPDNEICDLLAGEIILALAESENKIWHGHPVWFLASNPVVGYRKLKIGIQLLFWSGQSFNEEGLKPEGSFKAAEQRITDLAQINVDDLRRWLKKARDIQWDYKNIVKRKGRLERLK